MQLVWAKSRWARSYRSMRTPRRLSRRLLIKKELSINKGYDLTRQLQDVPEDQREQAAGGAAGI